MEIPKMIHVVDDYYIGADKHCIILYKRGEITGEGYRKAKPENIGKEVYTTIGYYSDLTGLARGLSKLYMLDGINDDNVKDFRDLAERMAEFVGKIKSIEEDYATMLAERMNSNDCICEDNEEEQ